MTEAKMSNIALLVTRLSLGWLMFYAGFSKIINPEWTSKGYLLSAKTFTGFYGFLASPAVLPYIDFVNKWALLLLGVSLLTGLFVRVSGYLGALLMVLYYLPGLTFPRVDHGILVDDHIVYAAIMIYFAIMAQTPLASWQKIRKMVRL